MLTFTQLLKALVQKLGADAVIDYTEGSWKTECDGFKGFDLVIDCVGLDSYWETFGRNVLGSHGRYITLNTLRAGMCVCVCVCVMGRAGDR